MTEPYFPGLVIPVLFILCGAFAKKLARGPGWQQSDFFLGVELCLAAMAAALIHGFELARLPVDQTDAATSLPLQFAATAGFIALCLGTLLWVITMHQDWEKREQNPRGQLVRLGIIANLLGAGLLATLVIFVTGV